jgi:hypothetical protein
MARKSTSRAALQTALEGAASAGARTQLLDIRRLDLPMYNPDEDEPTEAAATLIEACYAADGAAGSSSSRRRGIMAERPQLLPQGPSRSRNLPQRPPTHDARRAGKARRGEIAVPKRAIGMGSAGIEPATSRV